METAGAQWIAMYCIWHRLPLGSVCFWVSCDEEVGPNSTRVLSYSLLASALPVLKVSDYYLRRFRGAGSGATLEFQQINNPVL